MEVSFPPPRSCLLTQGGVLPRGNISAAIRLQQGFWRGKDLGTSGRILTAPFIHFAFEIGGIKESHTSLIPAGREGREVKKREGRKEERE